MQHGSREIALELGVSQIKSIVVEGKVPRQDDMADMVLLSSSHKIGLNYTEDDKWVLYKVTSNGNVDVLQWTGLRNSGGIVWIDQLEDPPILLRTGVERPTVSVLCIIKEQNELENEFLAAALIWPTLVVPVALLAAGYHLHTQGWHMDEDDGGLDTLADDYALDRQSSLLEGPGIDATGVAMFDNPLHKTQGQGDASSSSDSPV